MEAIITALLSAVGGGLVTGLFLRKKTNAETNRLSSDAWKDFAEKMEDRQNKLDAKLGLQEKKITRYGKRIIYLTKGIEILIDQIISEGKVPCWVPNEWDPECEE